MALDLKVLREQAVAGRIASGTTITAIPALAEGDVQAVLDYVANGPKPVPPPAPPAEAK